MTTRSNDQTPLNLLSPLLAPPVSQTVINRLERILPHRYDRAITAKLRSWSLIQTQGTPATTVSLLTDHRGAPIYHWRLDENRRLQQLFCGQPIPDHPLVPDQDQILTPLRDILHRAIIQRASAEPGVLDGNTLRQLASSPLAHQRFTRATQSSVEAIIREAFGKDTRDLADNAQHLLVQHGLVSESVLQHVNAVIGNPNRPRPFLVTAAQYNSAAAHQRQLQAAYADPKRRRLLRHWLRNLHQVHRSIQDDPDRHTIAFLTRYIRENLAYTDAQWSIFTKIDSPDVPNADLHRAINALTNAGRPSAPQELLQRSFELTLRYLNIRHLTEDEITQALASWTQTLTSVLEDPDEELEIALIDLNSVHDHHIHAAYHREPWRHGSRLDLIVNAEDWQTRQRAERQRSLTPERPTLPRADYRYAVPRHNAGAYAYQAVTSNHDAHRVGSEMNNCIGDLTDLLAADRMRIYTIHDSAGALIAAGSIARDAAGVWQFDQAEGPEHRAPPQDSREHLSEIAHLYNSAEAQ